MNNILSEWYSIIPNTVLFDNELKDKEKLLYCFIGGLCAWEWCTLTNKELAIALKNKTPKTSLTAETVSKYVNNLKKLWFLSIEYEYKWKQIIKRFIFITR